MSAKKTVVWILLTAVAFLVVSCWGGPESRAPNIDPKGELVLEPCPDSPNCVSTMAVDDTHRIEPLDCHGSGEETMNAIVAVVNEMVRTKIISQTETYLHVEYRTRIGFVDDVEFLLDTDGLVVHFRSASRVGNSDLGVNRRRMEEFRTIYEGAR